MSRPNFKQDLAFGQQGERNFMALAYKQGVVLHQTDGRRGDLKDKQGHTWEVKVDRYDHAKTANFFLEMYSDIDRMKLGGPGQALLNDCLYFAYYFPNPGIAYVFNTKDLVEQMKQIDLGKPKYVQNSRWTTVGYAVPRTLLKWEFLWQD